MPVPPGGISPASAFSPSVFAPQEDVPVILADLIDPTTGDFAALDVSADPTDAAVQVTLTTERGTGAAARNHGHSFRSLKHMDQVSPEAIGALAEEALKHLIDAGDVRIERVVVPDDVDPGQDDTAVPEIVFRNLRENRAQRRNLTTGEVIE